MTVQNIEASRICQHDLGWVASLEITKDGATLDDREFGWVYRCKSCKAVRE